MGQQSTLKVIISGQLGAQGVSLAALLDQYPRRSFVELQREIAARTGVSLSARTLRRWASADQTKEAT